MKKKLGLYLIRGAGKEGSKEQEKFIEKLFAQLRKENIDTDRIYIEYANWYGPTQNNQEIILDRITSSNKKIRALSLRKFIMYLVGDLVAYTGVPNRNSSSYEATHKKIHESIIQLKEHLEPNSPLVIIASSLATEIISNYIWDRQQTTSNDPFGGSSFERMDTLTGIFMLGNINPLYIASMPPDEARPFNFPSPNISTQLKKHAYWANLFDRNDPMGFPLKPINEYYNSIVNADISVRSGNFLINWNAASHLGYWKSKSVRKIISTYLIKVLSSL